MKTQQNKKISIYIQLHPIASSYIQLQYII